MNMCYLLALVLVALCAEQVAGAGKQLGRFIKEPCDYFYCANGGVCILGEDRHSEPTCQCTGHWKGDRCDDSPCQNVSCNSGSCYFDDNGSPHCCCPAGTSGEFCEIIVVCPQLENPLNGHVTVEGLTVGSTATYTCDSSTIALCIHETLTCGIDGVWNKERPICVEKISSASLRISYGDSTYFFSNDVTQIHSAQMFCKFLGGNLLSINSDEEWEFIKCVLSQFTSDDNRFIGLINNNGTWEWTSGQPVTVTYWSPAPTDSDVCTVIDGGNWKPGDDSTFCNSSLKFICENNNA